MNKVWTEGYKVMMKLDSEERERGVGFYRGRTYSKSCYHLFRKYKAFGFSHSVIEMLNPDYIEVKYEGNKYTINRDDFNENATLEKFKGFELQQFVPVKFFTKKREEKNNAEI